MEKENVELEVDFEYLVYVREIVVVEVVIKIL